MTLVGAKYFEKEKPGFGATRQSGSINSPRMTTGQSGNSKNASASNNPISRAKDAASFRKPSNMDKSNSS